MATAYPGTVLPPTSAATGVGKALLACGVASSLLYVGTDILTAFQYPGYSYADQAVSELSAIGAPTRPLWITMQLAYAPLLIAFGIGVRRTGRDRLLRVTGALLATWGALGFVWLFFPMHMRGAIGSTTDTMHLVLSGVTVVLIALIIGLGSGAAGRGFRVYSLATLAAVLACGALVARDAPAVAAQLPTPWMGLLERVSVYGPMLWVGVLAWALLRREEATARR